ncbi:hypothetical protein HZB00_04075 [Candidatus Woesearchaeota archaeon]|nr:hypothetical protein [Candidatus Woesearchaeota archaeon]
MAVTIREISEDLVDLLKEELCILDRKYTFSPTEEAQIPSILDEAWTNLYNRVNGPKSALLTTPTKSYLLREVESTLLAWRYAFRQ